MTDMTAFERQLSGEITGLMGPVRPVDDAAIFTAITATQSPRWRFGSMFSATKLVVAGAIVALFGGFLLAGVLTTGPSDESIPAAATDEAGSFSPAGSLADERAGHTSTLLPDGRVLVIGGFDEGEVDALASAEVWDPSTDSFDSAGSLIEARHDHTATLLPDGRVLVIGGRARQDGAFWARSRP